jgi:protein-tyrosine phosphatase
MTGTVKIYESSRPDSFDLYSPIAESDISKGYKDVFFAQSNKRNYFKLVFNNKYPVITAERNIPMQDLFNFRDLGGYYTEKGDQTRWGKLYRCSSLARTSLSDAKVLNNLGIQTVIDFRTDGERYQFPSKYWAPQTYTFPLRGNAYDAYADRILAKKWKAGDVKIYAQDMFSFFLENNSDYYMKMFDILLDENNYPVLMHCNMGSDRSAVASALILAALNIDTDQIVNDYLLSNDRIDLNLFIPKDNVFMQDPDIQETITAMYRVHRRALIYSFDRIKKEYGSMDNFFNTALKLTAKKREKLREIMLY